MSEYVNEHTSVSSIGTHCERVYSYRQISHHQEVSAAFRLWKSRTESSAETSNSNGSYLPDRFPLPPMLTTMATMV